MRLNSKYLNNFSSTLYKLLLNMLELVCIKTQRQIQSISNSFPVYPVALKEFKE